MRKNEAKSTMLYLQGGLGNQLYQIAIAKYFYGGNFLVNTYYLDKGKGVARQPSSFSMVDQVQSTSRRFNYKLMKFMSIFSNKIYIENKLSEKNENSLINSMRRAEKIMGYFQYKYFIDPLRSELRLRARKFDKFDGVGMHLRFGDFVKDPRVARHHGNLDLQYYKKALNLINFGKIRVFTDDVVLAKEMLKNLDAVSIEFVSEKPNQSIYDDFFGLSNCDSMICSNSTFALWAAYVSNSKNIIVPKEFYANRSDLNELLYEERFKIV